MLSVPVDVAGKECDAEGDDYVPSTQFGGAQQKIRPALERVQEAAAIIAAAKRPVIVVGRGAKDPQAQEVVAYWPALVPRDLVRPVLVTAAGEKTLDWPTPLEPAREPDVIELPPWPAASASTCSTTSACASRGRSRRGC